MIRGMTGFGRAAAQSSKGRVSVEIKSVNHRYFELITHLPPNFNLFEERIKKEIRSQLRRGRAVFVLNLFVNSTPKVHLNRKLAKHYFLELQKLSKELDLDGCINLRELASFEGVLSLSDSPLPADIFWPSVKSATKLALNQLVKMRKAEGHSIYSDINKKLAQIKEATEAIFQRRLAILEKKKRRLTVEEFGIFSKERDINEEITRLKFHVQNFKKQLHRSDAVGKELDFISQELQREINTTGAKSQDSKISKYVIKIKSLIEQIREQLQNIE